MHLHLPRCNALVAIAIFKIAIATSALHRRKGQAPQSSTMCDPAAINRNVTYVTPMFDNPVEVMSKIATTFYSEVSRSLLWASLVTRCTMSSIFELRTYHFCALYPILNTRDQLCSEAHLSLISALWPSLAIDYRRSDLCDYR